MAIHAGCALATDRFFYDDRWLVEPQVRRSTVPVAQGSGLFVESVFNELHFRAVTIFLRHGK
jgi:hypothetical protein